MGVLQWILLIVGSVLQVRVIATLLRGPYKEYPLVLAYTLALFLSTVINTARIIDTGKFSPSDAVWFWSTYVFRQFLMYSLVLSLIDRSLAGRQPALTSRKVLIPAAVIIAILPFYLHRSLPNISGWMTAVGRDISFCAAILNLLLWSILIGSGTKNRRLLMITGGLGIQFTGEAIGQSLRQLSASTLLIGNLFTVVPHLVCLYIWLQAFREQMPRPSDDLKNRAA
jgi:hypothetical protein